MRLLIEFAFFLMGWSVTVLLVALLGDRVAKMLRNNDRWMPAAPRTRPAGVEPGIAPSHGEPVAH